MVFFTGDIHGQPWNIVHFCKRRKPRKEDVIIILGDVGANYYGDDRDDSMKEVLAKLEPTIFCIHGNHEQRPANFPSYVLTDWCGGKVWQEEAYPNLLFAKDGEIFDIQGLKYLVIGGAYSVDKYYRLSRGYGWWPDEQPSEETKAFVEQQIREKPFDVILTHTCPRKYGPIEMFISGINQDMVDKSTEDWLDRIESSVDYLAWFCGHWHTDKRVDKMHFLFKSFENDDLLQRIKEKQEDGKNDQNS